jgi:hypothetical protein
LKKREFPMRGVFALLFCLVLVPYVGCGGGRPDPRERPDFVDTAADPKAAVVPGVSPDELKAKQAESAAPKP